MKFSIILSLVFFCALSYAADEGVEFEVGGKTDKANIQKLYKTESPDDSESGDGASSGDGAATDDTESSGDDNGSGSGIGSEKTSIDTTPTVVVVTTKPKKTKATTKKPKTSSSSTVQIINEITDEPTTKKKTTESNDIPEFTKSTEDPKNMAIQDTPKDLNKSGTVDFTVGIIVGVVVGAILAILVIVFLVYRLRKKDEGSYSLDEQSSQAFIRDEKTNPGQGKEYFA